MIDGEYRQRLEREMAQLPAGTIVRRTIRGRVRFYRQWREDGATHSRYLDAGSVAAVAAAIARRREIAALLAGERTAAAAGTGNIEVLRAVALDAFAAGARKLPRRHIHSALVARLAGTDGGGARMLAVCGSAGSGKTVCLQQALDALDVTTRQRAAYLNVLPQATPGETLSLIAQLAAEGIEAVAIDNLPAALAGCGMPCRRIACMDAAAAGTIADSAAAAGGCDWLTGLDSFTFAESALPSSELDNYLTRGGVWLAQPSEPGALAILLVRKALIDAARRNHGENFLRDDCQRLADELSEWRPARSPAAERLLGVAAEVPVWELTGETRRDLAAVKSMRPVVTAPGRIWNETVVATARIVEGAAGARLGAGERRLVREAISNRIRRRLFADAAIAAALRSGSARVCALELASGDSAMVLADEADLSCRLYGFEYSAVRKRETAELLTGGNLLSAVEHRFGTVAECEILYPGRTAHPPGMPAYRSIAQFLLQADAGGADKP